MNNEIKISYRYLVFAIDHMFPAGGMSDCIFKTADFEEAKKHVKLVMEGNPYNTNDYNIYDLVDDRVVAEFNTEE